MSGSTPYCRGGVRPYTSRPMIVAVPTETHPGEGRVAIVPAVAQQLVKGGEEVRVQAGAGEAAGYRDADYRERGAAIVEDRAQLFAGADVIVRVRTANANPTQGPRDIEMMKSGQALVGVADALSGGDAIRRIAERGVTLLAMELIPRITRAQEMDVLSSQASLAGYKAVIRAAELLPKIFPLMMTAAGTLKPAKVFVVGVGVAGLQAIATAKRLGAVVSAYDVRPAIKEQVQSLGATFVELPLDTRGAEDAGGYAKAQSDEQVRRQQELMARVVEESDVVICTASIPGKRAPVLVTRAMVEAMAPGSVIVDLAAERGGNCEVTQPGKTIDYNGVTIVGDDDFLATVAHHASQMYANNVLRYLRHLSKIGALKPDASAGGAPPADEILAATLVTRGGEVVHPRVREVMGLPPLVAAGAGAGA